MVVVRHLLGPVAFQPKVTHPIGGLFPTLPFVSTEALTHNSQHRTPFSHNEGDGHEKNDCQYNRNNHHDQVIIPPDDHQQQLSVLCYNILLPNSMDGWWTYKMYLPPLTPEEMYQSKWDYRCQLLRERIATVDADIVCLQEVSPVSFAQDFHFMKELGYDGCEMFKKGRFRPATFWKTAKWELASSPVHKDRTLLTAFRSAKMMTTTAIGSNVAPNLTNSSNMQHPISTIGTAKTANTWYVLNVHLQAGKEGKRRLRQIQEGVKAAVTLARKLKEPNPEKEISLIVCGDMNGGEESGAVRFLHDGSVDENFIEDGEQIASSGIKKLPLEQAMIDVMNTCPARSELLGSNEAPPTLVVPNLLPRLLHQDQQKSTTAYENPKFHIDIVERLKRLYDRLASQSSDIPPDCIGHSHSMNTDAVKRWLIAINQQVGRGSEFREAIRQMTLSSAVAHGNIEPVEEATSTQQNEADDQIDIEGQSSVALPDSGILTWDGFLRVYEAELENGKFWGIAHDLAVLGEPLHTEYDCFGARYDRIYCSSPVQPVAVMDFVSSKPCPNSKEPSDHLPIAASFVRRTT